ncbi:MAG TPA: hypothetical protein VJ911_01535 [Cryomorphaceae bacterium]|nr:hypothetical protein [Cryomorphaceae bacterium]
MHFTRPLITFFIVCLIASSCVKEEIDVEELEYSIQPEFGVPIARTTLKAEKVIENFDEDGLIDVAANGSLSLIYRDSVKNLGVEDILTFEDQEFETTVDLTPLEYTQLVANGSFTAGAVEEFTYTSDEGDRLDSIRFSTGVFSLDIDSEGNFPISGFVRILNEDGTEAFALNFQDQAPPIQISNQVEFTNRLLTLRNDSEISNGLLLEYEVTFTSEAGENYTPGPVTIQSSLTEYAIRTVGGYIAPRTVGLEDLEVELDLFKESFNGNFRISDPSLNLYFENGYGLGLGIEINELLGTTSEGDVLQIPGNNIQPLPVIQASQELGVPVNSVISITNESMTPTVTDFLSFMPQYVNSNLDVTVNPDDDDVTFISSLSQLNVLLEAEIPLYGSISDFLLVDTLDVDIGDLVSDANENDEVDALDIRLFVNNGFPFEAGTQIVFTDSLYNPLDSLFQNPDFVFSSAPVNYDLPAENPNYGRAVGKTPTVIDIPITNDRISDLENATRMIVRVFGGTSNNGADDIRLFANDEMDLSVAAKVRFKFDDDEN